MHALVSGGSDSSETFGILPGCMEQYE